MAKKKLSNHLIHLTEKDDFKTSFYILSTYPEEVNIKIRTVDGDYLVHCFSYACCEAGLEREKRAFALLCLDWILRRDFTAANIIASDGGSPLHCAISAASCTPSESGGDDDDDDNDDDDLSEDSESDEEEEDEGDNRAFHVDESFLAQLVSEANMKIIVGSLPSRICKFSSEDITITAIKLLLCHESDPNIPLANNGGMQKDDENEPELAYSKESILQGFNPLMFCLQWIFGVCMSNHENQSAQHLALPLLVLKTLLDAGSDPTYISYVTHREWNVLEIVASSAHVLSRIDTDIDTISRIKALDERSHSYLEKRSDFYHDGLHQIISLEKTHWANEGQSAYDFTVCLIKERIDKTIKLSKLQNFAVAISQNSVCNCKSIISELAVTDEKSKHDVVLEFRSKRCTDVFPPLQVLYGNNIRSDSWTLLDLACSNLFLEIMRYLCGEQELTLEKEELKYAIKSVFESSQSSIFHLGNDNEICQKQEECLSVLLGMESCDDRGECSEENQRLLDSLLLESCTGNSWAMHASNSTELLLRFNADPNSKSIARTIQDDLRSLHLVAGNCRGHDGVCRASSLLCHGADIHAKTSSHAKTALVIALEKKNALVAKLLWEELVGSQKSSLVNSHQQQTIKSVELGDLNWSIDHLSFLGEVSIECASLEMMHYTLDQISSMIASADSSVEETDKIQIVLGKLFLLIIDERSGFGKSHSSSKSCDDIVEIAKHFERMQTEFNLTKVATWSRDEISGHTPAHLLLRSDRGLELRKRLLPLICIILTYQKRSSAPTDSLLMIPCATKFGSYTAVDLARALNCEESVQILSNYIELNFKK